MTHHIAIERPKYVWAAMLIEYWRFNSFGWVAPEKVLEMPVHFPIFVVATSDTNHFIHSR